MPYSPTTWADTPATTSPISAANLNKIETELARLKVNADLDPAAAIAYSKLALALSIVNGDVSASAAIAYSKLNLASSIVNADVAAAAAIAASKLAAYPSDGTKFLAGDGTWKAATGTISKYGTLIDVNTSIAETDILQASGYTVAAGALGALGKARVSLSGNFLQASGGANNMTVRIYWGGTVIWANTLAYGNVAGRQPWHMQFVIANRNATNSQYMNGTMEFLQTAAAPTTGIGDALFTTAASHFGGPFAITADPAKDTTASQVIRVTFQWSVSNVNSSFQAYESTVEVL